MAKRKCPMAGISECTSDCMLYDDGDCVVFVGLKKIGEVADALGALKREIEKPTKKTK